MPKRLAIVGPYEVQVLDYEDPPLQAGQVRVRTELASGKHGTTTGMFDGRAYQNQQFDPELRLFVDKPGAIAPGGTAEAPGNSGTTGVGVVREVGPGVERWKVADRVFGHMDVRETNTCGADGLYALGEIAPETALLLEPAYVSIHCVRESNVRYGDAVVIIGLGALGLIAVEMARAAGAQQVFAVDMLANRRAWAAGHGADAVFDPREGDVALEIRRLTGGRGADVAIETAGAYPALNLATRCVRVAGTVCAAGFYQGEGQGLMLGREFHHNRLTMIVPHGCGWGHPPRDYPGWTEKRAHDAIVAMMRRGLLRCEGLIDPIVPIEQGQAVFAAMRDDPGRLLKYAVRF